MSKFDIIADRMAISVCPICAKDIGIEYQIVEDRKYGKVRICRNHEVKLIEKEKND